MSKEDGRRAYLDHASSSPLRPAAYEAMLPWLAQPGDPGRVHAEGRAARVALEDTRDQVAAFFGARPRELIFTSGGTEAINAAVFGAAARHFPVDFAALGAALCSVTAHKLGGRKGTGALLVRRGLRLPPFLLGGAQERNRRAGVENVAAAVGFAAAVAELAGAGL